LASDDKVWHIYFNVETKHPEIAYAATKDQITTVHIKKGNYRPVKYFEKKVFDPRICSITKNLFS